MNSFAALLVRRSTDWSAREISVDHCESVEDIADLARDEAGDLRLVVIEQDDEYAAIVRVDEPDDEVRAFLTDGHAADAYPLAAAVAEDLVEIGDADPPDDDGILADTPLTHDHAPFGDPAIAEDLGTPAADLLDLCGREGTLPVDVLVAVCEKAGCGDLFEDLRA